jgi:hypothetical protein
MKLSVAASRALALVVACFLVGCVAWLSPAPASAQSLPPGCSVSSLLATGNGSVTCSGVTATCSFNAIASVETCNFSGACTGTVTLGASGLLTNSLSCGGPLQSAAATAQNASRVSLGVVQAQLTSIRDSIQKGGSTRGKPLGYAEEEESDRALGYTDPKSPRLAANPLYTKAKEPPKGSEPWLVATWAQGFGDYEARSGTFNGVDIGHVTGTGGGVAGIDVTIPHLFVSTDAWVIGLLGGDTQASVHNNDGSSARVHGPGVGVYSVYVNGGFSQDSVFKVDFFDLDSTDAVGNTTPLRLVNSTFATNLNYKFLNGNGPSWVEPTVGASYTNTRWDSASLALGLTNGEQWRVQAGVRVGTLFMWNGAEVEPTLAALAYDDVSIVGGTLVNAVTPVAPSDEGKVFGQLIGKVNFDWGDGFSNYVEAEVRGRENVLGLAARFGARYVFSSPK